MWEFQLGSTDDLRRLSERLGVRIEAIKDVSILAEPVQLICEIVDQVEHGDDANGPDAVGHTGLHQLAAKDPAEPVTLERPLI